MMTKRLTTDELNRAIGKLRGWYVKTTLTANIVLFITLFTPEGEQIITFEELPASKEAQDDPLTWALDRAWFEHFIPRWSTDANAALELLPPRISIVYPDDGIYWICEIASIEDDRHIRIKALTPARVICEAWLRWKSEQE